MPSARALQNILIWDATAVQTSPIPRVCYLCGAFAPVCTD
jgi:hypothetical protein